MESIKAFELNTRLFELLERTQRGETFEITIDGRPVGKLIPPDPIRDPQAIAAAVKGLLSLRGTFGKLSKEEIIALKHEGHRI